MSARGMGEKNVIVTIFTENLGLIHAKAISSRESKGKLKGHITPYSFGLYTFVRGKERWRLIQAEAEKNFMTAMPTVDKKKIMARVARLIGDLAGETKESRLFDLLASGLDVLVGLNAYLLRVFETVMVSRLLFVLGFLSFDALPDGLKNPEDFSEKSLVEFKPHVKTLISRINQGLKESQLIKMA